MLPAVQAPALLLVLAASGVLAASLLSSDLVSSAAFTSPFSVVAAVVLSPVAAEVLVLPVVALAAAVLLVLVAVALEPVPVVVLVEPLVAPVELPVEPVLPPVEPPPAAGGVVVAGALIVTEVLALAPFQVSVPVVASYALAELRLIEAEPVATVVKLTLPTRTLPLAGEVVPRLIVAVPLLQAVLGVSVGKLLLPPMPAQLSLLASKLNTALTVLMLLPFS